MYEKLCQNCATKFLSVRSITKFCCWDCMMEYRSTEKRMIRVSHMRNK